MAGQGPNNNSFSGQAQMTRDSLQDHSENQNFLSETGTHAKNMAQGAADVGKGAVLGAASLARGVATGAANVATGAADAIKNTFGGATESHHSNNASLDSSTHLKDVSLDNSAHPSTNQSAYPNKPSYPHVPN